MAGAIDRHLAGMAERGQADRRNGCYTDAGAEPRANSIPGPPGRHHTSGNLCLETASTTAPAAALHRSSCALGG